MPIDREYLLAPVSSNTTGDGLKERLKEELKKIDNPQSKNYWLTRIKGHTNGSDWSALNIFHGLILDSFLIFLRIYRGHAIYVSPSTPIALYDKMPVIELET